MEDRIPEDEKTRRLMALNEKQRAMQIRRNAALVGSVEEVLVEGRNQSLGQWIGRTSQNRTLNFHASGAGRRFTARNIPECEGDALGPQLAGRRSLLKGQGG